MFGPSSSSPDALENGALYKRKRRPAGTPDPDAEVVSLSPNTLLESDRYICEICNQGFQRDQNLQMHRRRHKVPWKLLKRENLEVKKRVFVCPEPSCLHHDPCHALGDLVGIKKHYRRKHSSNKQWVCEKCSKGYAVQSDYKAHLKTCGTRGHSCDCGRVFSRVESFIEHQDTCTVRYAKPELSALQASSLSRTASSTSQSNDTILFQDPPPIFSTPTQTNNIHNLELQLLPSLSTSYQSLSRHENSTANLKLSIGTSSQTQKNQEICSNIDEISQIGRKLEVSRLREGASEELKIALAEKAYAEEARQHTKKQIEMAEREFANSKRIRQQAQAELEKAQRLREQAIKRISSTILQITCHSCKHQFEATASESSAQNVDQETSYAALSYMSSAITGGEGQ